MKKFISLLMALVMAMSLCAPAWGAGEATELPEAVNGVITLTEDVTLADTFEVAAGVTVTLDLGSYTLSYTAKEAKASCAINNKGTLTITNGTVTYCGVGDPNFGYGTNTVNNTGKLTIDGASIINTTSSGSSVAIDCSAGAELLVKSGEITSVKNAIRLCPFSDAAINCTIDGGTITGARAIQIQLPSNKPAEAPDVDLTVNDGTLTGTGDYSIYSYSYGQSFANVDVTLNGGTYNGDVAFGGGSAKSTQENVTVTGGIFKGYLGRFLANNGWEDIAKPVYVASVAGKDYTSLQAALNAGGEVTLLDNVTESVTVPAGKIVTLNLNGKTITAPTGELWAVENAGTLTVSGSGTIAGGYSALYSTGNLAVDGGNFTATDGFGLLVDNMYGQETSVAVINSGSFTGVGVYNPTDVTINGGTFNVGKDPDGWTDQNDNAEFAMLIRPDIVGPPNTATVTVDGGTFNGDIYIYDDGITETDVTINGGNFGGEFFGNNDGAVGLDVFTVKGGYFTTDPSAYCAEGKTGVTSDKAGYLYMVGEKNTEIEKPAEVVVATPAPEVNVTTTNDTEKAVVDELKKADAVDISTDALTAQAKDIANNTEATATEDHAKELDKVIENNPTPIAKEAVTIVVQPYFDVAVQDVEVETETTGETTTVTSASITVNITPMYQTVATTKDVVDDNKDIVLEKKDEDDVVNAVVVGEAKELTVTEPVTITIAIPAALAIDDGNSGYKSLFVTHVKDDGTSYVYEAKVEGNDTAGFTATFTNPNGFSLFTLSLDNPTVAEVNEVPYATLQSAVDAVADGGTITYKSNENLSAQVKEAKSFTVVYADGMTGKATITAAAGFTLKQEGNTYTVTNVTSGGYYPTTPSTPNVNVDVDNGTLNNAAQAVGGAITGGTAEMKPVGSYTKEDIAKLQAEGKLNLVVDKKVGYDSVADKNLIDNAIAKAGGAVVGTAVMYFDIDVMLKTDDGAVVATVTDTKKPLSITVDLNADLQKAAKDGKIIYVVRVHEGKTAFLDTSLNANKTKATFSSSDFSTFAVVAMEKEVGSAQTFDAGILLYVGMGIAAAAGSAVVIGKKKEF